MPSQDSAHDPFALKEKVVHLPLFYYFSSLVDRKMNAEHRDEKNVN